MRSSRITGFQLLWICCLAAPTAEGESVELLLKLLDSPRQEERVDAQTSLAPSLLDPDAVSIIASRLPALPPEARLRIRGCVANTPACAAALLHVSLSANESARAGARDLLLGLLTAETARRLEQRELLDEPEQETAFPVGVITGLETPLGDSLPLWFVLLWLQQTVTPNEPIVLRPGLAEQYLTAVRPEELLPTTASALLGRLLHSRGLALADVGLVRLVVPKEDAEAFEESLGEAPEKPSEPDGRDVLGAAVLLPLLLDDPHVVSDPGAQALLFHALAMPGSADAAARLADVSSGLSDGLLALLPLGSHRAPTDWYVEMLGGEVPDEVRTSLQVDIVRSPPLARRLVPLLLEQQDAARRLAGCYLAARIGVGAARDQLVRAAGAAERDVRIAAAIALVRAEPRETEYATLLGDVLALGISGRAVRAAMDAALNSHVACPTGLPVDRLLRAPDSRARSVGAALLALEGATAVALAGVLRPSDPHMLAAWALTATRSIGRTTATAQSAAPVLAAFLARSVGHEGALAMIQARLLDASLRGAAWTETAEVAAATNDSIMLRTQLAIVALDIARNEDFRASRLRTVLRAHRNRAPLINVAYRELWSVLTAEEAGQEVRLLSERLMPFAP